uniref:INCENP_ARK-bind domain-containing protein n=1 Tax=Schistosoma mansoni TaxID=6183 RepID=A0A3Q0KS49_SCHMA
MIIDLFQIIIIIIQPWKLFNYKWIINLIIFYYLIPFMFCIKIKTKKQKLKDYEKLIRKNTKKLLHNHNNNKGLHHNKEDKYSDKHVIQNGSNSKCIIENQIHPLCNRQYSNVNNLDLDQSNQILIKTLTTKINLNEKHQLSNMKSIPFTVWFIKIAQKFLYWKNSITNMNISTQSNYSHIINENPIQEYPKSINLNTIHHDNLNKITIQKSLNDKETFESNIQHIKQKANSLKEQGRRAKVYHGYPIWTDTKSVIQPFSNRISPNSTTHYHLSPYRQCDSQSDLFDPIYSAIQYPLKDTIQSTHSSSWNHSSVSFHQPYVKDRLLVRNIWTSQDSVVSDAHVYCELIELKSDKIHYPTNKKFDSRPSYKDYSTCSLRSHDNPCFQDVISDKYSADSVVMKHMNEPPKLPLRNYGESTLNMVANLRLWATRNKQKILKNFNKLNKLHKHVYSMSDIPWRLDKKKNYSEQSSFRYHKYNLIEKSKNYDELTKRNTRSTFSETDIISLENLNSFNIWGPHYRKDQINSAYHSNEAFSLEVNVQSTKQSTNFNDRCNNLRHIDSESDIIESSPYRNKSPGSEPLKLNNSSYSYLTSTSFTPLYHIYIPNQCNHTQTQQSKETFHSCTNDLPLQCNNIYNQTNTIHSHILSEDIPYPSSSLCMPPLMERSMEDDEYNLYK